MNNGGDAAEQVVRLSLEGFEVAARLSGSAAKNINCSEDNKKKLNEISNSLGLGNVYTSRIHSEQYTIDYVR